MVGSDAWFRMGSTHAICQDYAVADEEDGHHYAMVSDGCSGGRAFGQPAPQHKPQEPYTDFGSRFIIRAAVKSLHILARGTFPDKIIAQLTAYMLREVYLPSPALNATLLAAVSTNNGDVMTYQVGDGVMAWRKRDGSFTYRSLEFANNTPVYLSYLLDDKLMEMVLHPSRFYDLTPEQKEIEGTVEVVQNTFIPGKGWGTQERTRSRIEDVNMAFPTVLYKENVDTVLLMSDGAESFVVKDGGLVALEDVLTQVFDMKGMVGCFVNRRLNAFTKRFCPANNWQHQDDFSVAGVHLG
jgi:hypothetical protein